MIFSNVKVLILKKSFLTPAQFPFDC